MKFLFFLFVSLKSSLSFAQEYDTISQAMHADFDYAITDTVLFEGYLIMDPNGILLYEKDEIRKIKTNFKSLDSYNRYFKNKKCTPYLWAADLWLFKGNINTNGCTQLNNMPVCLNQGIKIWEHEKSSVIIYPVKINLYTVKIKKDALKRNSRYVWIAKMPHANSDQIVCYTFYDCIK